MVCRLCQNDKAESEFSLRNDSGRHRPDCKSCRATHEAAKRYGVTVGDVEVLREQQDNRCAICGTAASDVPHSTFKHNPLVIDHNHATGKLRGLLCPTCNVGIGQFQDDPELCLQAFVYLTKHK